MEPIKLPNDRIDRKFQGSVRHYHRKGADPTWDDWTGVKPKSPRRKHFERVALKSATLIVGMLLICGTLFAIYFVIKIILSA